MTLLGKNQERGKAQQSDTRSRHHSGTDAFLGEGKLGVGKTPSLLHPSVVRDNATQATVRPVFWDNGPFCDLHAGT